MALSKPPVDCPDSKQSLLPLPSSSPSAHAPHRTHSRLSRTLNALLTVAALATLYLRYAPTHPAHAAWHPSLAGYANHAVSPDPATTCPHSQKYSRISDDEVRATVLSVPSAESARNASHAYTTQTHVAGTPGDKHVALLLKQQWEALLGLPASGEEKHVWDAGTQEADEALKGPPHPHHKHYQHRRPSLAGRLKRVARQALRRAGLPTPAFLRRAHHPRPAPPPRVWTTSYYPLLNYPLSSSLTYTPSASSAEEGDTPFRARLEENVLEQDPTSGQGVRAWHGLSKNGTAKGRLVYASKGSPEDFAELARRGIDVRGAVVLVQYGSLFRGLKVKAAAEAGAVGVLIYDDPIADGEATEEKGERAYPDGPAREPSSIQRGSVQYLSSYPGDSLTPGLPAYNPSLPNSPPRLPANSSELNMPTIPSLPISYADALPLLLRLNGRGSRLEDGREGKREGWREGGLGYKGVEYWTGPSEGEVEMVNNVEDKVTAIWNTYALIPGRVSDEVVVLGNHHDAWTFGAGDPSSGTAAVHEVVRALGALVRKGWRPLRTVLVAGWDAEEYGLMGSTEFGEDYATWLQERVVAYLNVDVAVSGSAYTLNASPSLADFLIDVSAQVADPDAKEGEGKTLRDKVRGVEALGSGSDFTVFLQRLGIASTNIGYERTSSEPVYHYHSNYDSAYWQDRFGDPSFRRHEAIAKALGLATVRLADEAVLPLNLTAYATALTSYVDAVAHLPGASSLSLAHLHNLTLRLRTAALSLSSRCSSVLAALRASPPPQGEEKWALVRELREINKRLVEFERGFLGDGQGLRGREWYKHLGVAPGRWLGYGATTLPGLTEALTLDKDVEQAQHEVARLEKAFEGILAGLEGR
ncbi:hypothetical protein JCM10207_005504 [Rhodosporidiobolus poonsookiae]